MQLTPSIDLSHLVKHYLILDHQAHQPTSYRFFPDGNPGLVFSYAEPWRDGQLPLANSFNHFVYGQASHYHDLLAGKTIGLFIVVLQPWGLHSLSGMPGPMTMNTRLRLDHLFGARVDTLQEKVMASLSLSERINQVEAFLRQHRPVHLSPQTLLIQEAVLHIQQTGGLATIQQLIQTCSTTERSLERHFNQVMGIGPKQFSRIVRLQHSLKLHRQQPALSLTQLAYNAGYYDQAHFIREFSQLAGITPKFYTVNTERLAVNLMPLIP